MSLKGRCVRKVIGPYVVIILNWAFISQEWAPERYVTMRLDFLLNIDILLGPILHTIWRAYVKFN